MTTCETDPVSDRGITPRRTPATLTSEELRHEQSVTLSSVPRRYSLTARLVFVLVDLLLGRRLTLSKFKGLELIARVSYQACEQVAYSTMTLSGGEPGRAHRVYEVVRRARAQQDNEQWHWLVLEELTERRAERESVLRHRLLPHLLASPLFHLSCLLYTLWPELAHRINADFEDHAERDYMQFVQDNPGLEDEPFVTAFEAEFGCYASVADALRRIALDEREHKECSTSYGATRR